jgi:hypothetical protein
MRTLLLITKIIQNIANGIIFIKKEEFLKPFNNFIDKFIELTRSFFDQAATIEEGTDLTKSNVLITTNENKEDFQITHRYLFNGYETFKNNDKIKKENLKELEIVMEELGKPIEENKEQTLYFTKEFKSQEMNDFFKKIEDEFDNVTLENLITEWNNKKIFYKGGFSKEKRPVLYFVAKNFDDTKLNEFSIYYILKLLQSVFIKPYEIVFDSTMWNKEINEELFIKIYSLLPGNIILNH